MNLKVQAKLDPKFQPLSVVVREMREATKENGQDVIVAIERNKGQISTYKTRIYPDGTGHDEENFRFIERIVKSIQISDTGIVPGGGVENAQKELTLESIGVPVIAIGIPTVVDLR